MPNTIEFFTLIGVKTVTTMNGYMLTYVWGSDDEWHHIAFHHHHGAVLEVYSLIEGAVCGILMEQMEEENSYNEDLFHMVDASTGTYSDFAKDLGTLLKLYELVRGDDGFLFDICEIHYKKYES